MDDFFNNQQHENENGVQDNPSTDENVNNQECFAEEQMPLSETKKPKKKRTGLVIAITAVAALVIGCVGGAILGGYFVSKVETTQTESFVETEEETADYYLEEVPIANKVQTAVGDKSLTPADVYSNNVGAVVGISTESTPTTNIFGQISSTSSAGSGFVLSEDGYVVTNYHVVEGASTIKVTLYSGESYSARLIGSYADNDVALLKIEAAGLQHVTVGKSSELVVGEQIVAIGNPLGELTYTMTVGYVSAMDREINASGKPINMLQTDVAINSGNSGGPIFDMNGNVVAIASAKYSGQTTSGTYIEGLSFAIPIDDVLDILFDLGTYGYVTGKPYLGVMLKDLDAATAATYGLPVGPIIDSVEAGSCAEKAGMLKGDIILALGDAETNSYDALVSALRKYRAGDSAAITVYRSGQEVELTVIFDEKVTQQPAVSDPPVQEQQPQQETVPSFGYDDYFGFGFPFEFFFGG